MEKITNLQSDIHFNQFLSAFYQFVSIYLPFNYFFIDVYCIKKNFIGTDFRFLFLYKIQCQIEIILSGN